MTSRFVLPLADVGAGITPSSGAQLFFYETGTTTPKDTYSDAAGTTPNANPVVANSVGVFPDIFISGTYKVVLKNTDGVQQWAADPVTSDDSVYVSKTELAAAGGAGLVGYDARTIQQIIAAIDGAPQASPNKKYRLVGGVIRNSGTGWEFIDDEGHKQFGFAGTVTDNGYTLELDYDFSGATVGTLVACPDDSFAKMGLTFGASVGVNEAVLSFGVRNNFYAIGTTVAGRMLGYAQPTITDNGTYLDIVTGPGGGSVSSRGDAPTLTPFTGGGRYLLEADHRDVETTRLRAYSPLAAKIYYDGTEWQIDSEHDISLSFASGELILTVGGGGYKGVPVVGKFGPSTAYDPVITAYNGSTINIKFSDSGAFVVPVDTNMSFTLGAGNTLITDHSLVGFCMDRGYGAGTWSELISAAGNIWILGVIEVA